MKAFYDEVAEAERRVITCQPIPAKWATLAARTDIQWEKFPFEASAAGDIPRSPGFFCLFVGDPPADFPAVGFPLYFGRTDRTLRRRFATLIQEQQGAVPRPQVRDFLEVFEGELTFLCSVYDGPADKMTETAQEILDALRPAFSDPEFAAAAQLGQGAW